jgi:hypothetical protein
MGIEERIEVTGAESSKRKFDEVADAQQRVGDAADQAGRKGEEAGGKFDQAAGSTNAMADGARRVIAEWLGLQSVIQLVRDLIQALEEVIQKQDEVSGKAVDLAEVSRPLARQLGVGEAKGVQVLTQLRRSGGLDARSARDFGIAADIAFGDSGGLLAGQNFATTRTVAAFGGAKGFTGAQLAALFELLDTAGKLDSPEQAKLAIAQLSAASDESRAANVGEFASQVKRGATGQLLAGVSYEDVLTQAVQARQAEDSGELAAGTSATLEQVAIAGAEEKFNREIANVARSRGLDPRTLSSAQRVGISRDIFAGIDNQAEQDRIAGLLSPERFLRLSKAFRASNLDATAGAGAAIAGATATDFDLTVEQGQQELPFRRAQYAARADFGAYQSGKDRFTISQLRQLARARLDEEIAQGIVLVTDRSRPAEEDRILFELLQSETDALEREGTDVSGVREAIESVAPWIPYEGYVDSQLTEVGSQLDNARRRGSLNRQAALRQQQAINVTVVGTQYNAPDDLVDPPPPVDVGQ